MKHTSSRLVSDGDVYADRETYKERKKRGVDSAALAKDLINMNDYERNALDLSENVREELDLYLRIKSYGARQRQERRLAGALRLEAEGEVEGAIENVHRDGLADARLFQKLEYWRTYLMKDDASFDKYQTRFSELEASDFDDLRGALVSAREEKLTSKPKGAGRQLFRLLRSQIEELL